MIPGLARSPGEGKGYPLQYSGLENFMDSIVLGVSESVTTEWLSLHYGLSRSMYSLQMKCRDFVSSVMVYNLGKVTVFVVQKIKYLLIETYKSKIKKQ